ncbi:Uncharacterized protein TCM_042644 [Theobroma cacao]|uniref:Uncharacterized protein n=1 Tax=Theobroma cacao TaxID=3641 RepID=A0A061FMP1_THECC|nr:Uncharacterized protein TCM_042644 [Theobroma cacao]
MRRVLLFQGAFLDLPLSRLLYSISVIIIIIRLNTFRGMDKVFNALVDSSVSNFSVPNFSNKLPVSFPFAWWNDRSFRKSPWGLLQLQNCRKCLLISSYTLCYLHHSEQFDVHNNAYILSKCLAYAIWS